MPLCIARSRIFADSVAAEVVLVEEAGVPFPPHGLTAAAGEVAAAVEAEVAAEAHGNG
jgi:hypothetical protein